MPLVFEPDDMLHYTAHKCQVLSMTDTEKVVLKMFYGHYNKVRVFCQ